MSNIFGTHYSSVSRAVRDIFASSPDDLRRQGWVVAVHNDYRMNHEPHTFWLLTKGDRAIKGEGKSDAIALNQIREKLLKEQSNQTDGEA